MVEGGVLSDDDNVFRTCFLNSHYVKPLDFELDEKDKEFLFQIGERDAIEWIKDHALRLKERGEGQEKPEI